MRTATATPAVAESGTEKSSVGERPAGGRRRPFPSILKIAVATFLLYLLLRDTPIAEVADAIVGASFGYVALALALNVLGLGIAVQRWKGLLKSQEFDVPALRLFESCLVAVFFNNFLPSTVGGDAVRVYDSWKLGVHKITSVTVVFIDRFLGFFALLLFALIGSVLLQNTSLQMPVGPAWLVASTVAGVLLIALLFSSWELPASLASPLRYVAPAFARRVWTRFVEPLATFRGRGRALFRALGLSVILQANVVVFYFVLGSALSLEVTLVGFFIIVPFALFIMMLPVSINAIGLREGAFVLLLGLYGVAKADAIALAWLAYGLVLVQGIVGGVVYAARR